MSDIALYAIVMSLLAIDADPDGSIPITAPRAKHLAKQATFIIRAARDEVEAWRER